MKQKITDDEMDALLHQYMPLAEEKWIAALMKKAEEEPHVFSERFERNMAHMIEEYDRECKKKRRSLIRRIAAVFFVIVSVSFALCMSVEATRESFIEFVEKIHSDWTEYRYVLKEGTKAEFVLIEPGYLPEGYSEYGREDMGDAVYIYYQKEKQGVDTEIIYEESTADGLTVGLDTEGAMIKVEEIAGEKVEYFENKGVGYVYWTDANTYYNIIGRIDVNELLKMAKSVINSENYKEK